MAEKPKVVYIFINGILAHTGQGEGWQGRAVTWTHLNTGAVAEKFEYKTLALQNLIFRWQQEHRAWKVAKMVRYYGEAGYKIRMVGHSNGCDLLLRVMQLHVQPIDELHLLSPACEADCGNNGLNKEITDHGVNLTRVYVAENDWALRAARVSRLLLGKFGYGTMGLHGPINADSPIEVVRLAGGHSVWFEDANFQQTMETVTRNAPPKGKRTVYNMAEIDALAVRRQTEVWDSSPEPWTIKWKGEEIDVFVHPSATDAIYSAMVCGGVAIESVDGTKRGVVAHRHYDFLKSTGFSFCEIVRGDQNFVRYDAINFETRKTE